MTWSKIVTAYLYQPSGLPCSTKNCRKNKMESLLQSSHFGFSLKPSRISAGQVLPGYFQGTKDVTEPKKSGFSRNLKARVGVRRTIPFLVGSSADISTPVLSQNIPSTLERWSQLWYALFIGNQLHNWPRLLLNAFLNRLHWPKPRPMLTSSLWCWSCLKTFSQLHPPAHVHPLPWSLR